MIDIDQSPFTVDNFEMYQGIANLAPNGPLDGGLTVVKGSHLLHKEYFSETGGYKEAKTVKNGYKFEVEEMEWFKNRGCEVMKVCAGEGDLIRASSLSFCSAYFMIPLDRLIGACTETNLIANSSVGLPDDALEYQSRRRADPFRNLCVLLPAVHDV